MVDLKEYIKDNKQRGYTDQQIVDYLISQGYPRDTINKVYNDSYLKTKVYFAIFSVLGVIILSLGLMYFFNASGGGAQKGISKLVEPERIQQNDLQLVKSENKYFEIYGTKIPIKTDTTTDQCGLLIKKVEHCAEAANAIYDKLINKTIDSNKIYPSEQPLEQEATVGCPEIIRQFGNECVDCKLMDESLKQCMVKNYYSSNNETTKEQILAVVQEYGSSGQLEHCNEEFESFQGFCEDYMNEK